jgi:hypothetical protein
MVLLAIPGLCGHLQTTGQVADCSKVIRLLNEVIRYAIVEEQALTGQSTSYSLLQGLLAANSLLDYLWSQQGTIGEAYHQGLLQQSRDLLANLKPKGAQFPRHYFLAYRLQEGFRAIEGIRSEAVAQQKKKAALSQALNVAQSGAVGVGSLAGGTISLVAAIAATGVTAGTSAPLLVPAVIAFASGCYQAYLSAREVLEEVQSIKDTLHKEALISYDIFGQAMRETHISLPWEQLLTIFETQNVAAWQGMEAIGVIYYVTELTRAFTPEPRYLERIKALLRALYIRNANHLYVQTFVLETLHLLHQAGYEAYPGVGKDREQTFTSYRQFLLGNLPSHYGDYILYHEEKNKPKKQRNEDYLKSARKVFKDDNALEGQCRTYYQHCLALEQNLQILGPRLLSLAPYKNVPVHEALHQEWFSRFSNDELIYQALELYRYEKASEEAQTKRLLAIERRLKQAEESLEGSFTSTWGRGIWRELTNLIEVPLQAVKQALEEEKRTQDWANQSLISAGSAHIKRLISGDRWERNAMTIEEADAFYKNMKATIRQDHEERYQRKIVAPKVMDVKGHLEIDDSQIGNEIKEREKPLITPSSVPGTLFNLPQREPQATAVSQTTAKKNLDCVKIETTKNGKGYQVTLSYHALVKLKFSKADYEALNALLIRKQEKYQDFIIGEPEITAQGKIKSLCFEEEEMAQAVEKAIKKLVDALLANKIAPSSVASPAGGVPGGKF